MKTILTLTTFLFFALAAQAQDYIVKRDGTKIEAKVLEISSTEIRYKLFTQPDGPLRIIRISEVEEIIYEDGQFDKFEQRTSDSGPVSTTASRPPVEEKNPISQGGFFIEALIGYGQYQSREDYVYYDYYGNYYIEPMTERYNEMAFTIRFGNKWYFAQKGKWSPGLQATWLRLGNYIDTRNIETMFVGTKTISIANVGMANAFDFGNNLGMEANFSVGPTIAAQLNNGGYANLALLVAPEVKFRFKSLAVGLDYSYIWGNVTNGPDRFNVLSLSIGAKF